MSPIVEKWLESYGSKSSKDQYKYALGKFEEYLKTDVKTIIEEYKATQDKEAFNKKWCTIVVKFYNDLIEKQGMKINSARNICTGVRAFFSSQMTQLRIPRGKIGKPQMAFGEHEFKLEQLQRMFRVANIREKAILSLGVCLGYGVSDFARLKREFLEKIIAQTEFEDAPIGFWFQRKKTSAPFRSHITKEAIECLVDYWKTLPEKSEWAFPNSSLDKHISTDALNYTIQTLTEKAKIETMGTVRFHLLRKFLFSALTNVMDEVNAKLCVGKTIPLDVLTYLKGKTDVLKEQYSKAEQYFVLSGFTNHDYSKMAELEAKLQLQDEKLQKFLDVFTAYLEDKIGKTEAVHKTKTILTESYARILSDEEAKQEAEGQPLKHEDIRKYLKPKKDTESDTTESNTE